MPSLRHQVSTVALTALATVTLLAPPGATAAPVDLNRGTLEEPLNPPASGDFNGDGNLDLASQEPAQDERFTLAQILPGDGDGDFGAPGPTTQTRGSSTVVADMNGDGRDDILLGTSVAFGRADGTFEVGDTDQDFNGSFGLATDDLDADGDEDLVVAEAITGGVPDDQRRSLLATYLNDGSGLSFERREVEVLQGDAAIAAPSVGDLNGDGSPDVAVCPQRYDGGLEDKPGLIALENDGTGSFEVREAGTAQSESLCGSSALADVNGDGIDDVMTNRYEVFLGSASGPLVAGGRISGGPRIAASVNLADIDRDGATDAVFGRGGVEVWRGGGDGSFSTGAGLRRAAPVRSVATIDLDGDGTADDLFGVAEFDAAHLVWANRSGAVPAAPDTVASPRVADVNALPAPIELDSDDPDAVFECSFNFGPYGDCEAGPTETPPDGTYVVRARAVSAAGPDPTPVQQLVRFDTTAPKFKLRRDGSERGYPRFQISRSPFDPDIETPYDFFVRVTNPGGAAGAVRFELDISKQGATISVADMLPGPPRKNLGTHRLYVTATDAAENRTFLARKFVVRANR